MALPIERVVEIDRKGIEVLTDYYNEINQAFAKRDLMKVGELRSCVGWVKKIVAMANKPYVPFMRPMIPDDILRTLGLLDEDS